MINKRELNTIISFEKETVVSEYTKTIKSHSYQSEEQMEKEFIKKLCLQGYEYLNNIKNNNDLKLNLRNEIERLNNHKFTDNEWDTFIKSYLLNSDEDINKKTNKIQKDFICSLKLDSGVTKNIYIIDKKNIHNNKLQVINQFECDKGKYKNRYDVTILVNGIPMIHIELKKRGIDIREAFNQIERYKNESFFIDDSLYKFIQVFVISNGTETKYYANTTRYLHIEKYSKKVKSKSSHSFEFTNYWSDSKNKIIYDIEDFTETFFAKHTILNILTKYCIYTSDEKLLVMRPYQIVAVERILNKILISNNYKEKLGTLDAGGYVWHTTGSGKTVTSFKAAQLALNFDFVKKVLFVVDRKDLDYQTMKEYDNFEKDCANSNGSTKILQQQLENDNSKIIITTIQKLFNFVKNNKKHKIYNEHVVIIFDECHRSQLGNMHQRITTYFKKYNIFGFTGTPLFSKNVSKNPSSKEIADFLAKSKDAVIPIKTTEQTFDERLHTYNIKNAINDKNVLPFKYYEYNTLKEKENIIDQKVQGIDTERIWTSPERISKITKYIIDNFQAATYRQKNYSHSRVVNTTEIAKDKKNKTHQQKECVNVSGFNSIFAVQSIEAAKLYYSEFKKQLSKRNDIDLVVATIFSYCPNESINDIDDSLDIDEDNSSTDKLDLTSKEFLESAINDYNKWFNTSYSVNGDSFQSYYKDISLKLKNKEIDILIVVNMFLTGFDATTLNTLWVDKWLKMHGLIQAFSRTNRILNSIKQFGNIISFRPLNHDLKEAITLFGDDDASSLILIKSFDDYYNGYQSNDGVHTPGYKELVNNLLIQFPLTSDVMGEKDKKDFVLNFGKILKIRNILNAFVEFHNDEKEILTERELQDYLSRYQNYYEDFKRKEKTEKIDIIDDLVYEIDLVKQFDVGVDYILNEIKEMKQKNKTKDEIVISITRMLESSHQLRSKKELIIDFINSLNNYENLLLDNFDIENEFFKFKDKKYKVELDSIIEEFKLNYDGAYEYMENCIEIGKIVTNGTNLDEIWKKSLFNNNRSDERNKLVDRLEKFFNTYGDI